MIYGLIGEKLGHSFSKEIHESINDYKYDLMEIRKEDLEDFLLKKDFKGINVTIPYKQDVIKYLDYIDPIAKRINAVNTIVNNDGKLFGYNTDYYGLKALIEKNNIIIKNKIVLILGSGGTSKTSKTLVTDLGAKDIYIVSRTSSNETISYDDLNQFYNEEVVIINTTPCGMYPNNLQRVIDVKKFQKLTGYVDVIYNPLRTINVIESSPSIGGLYMLVAQAVFAHDIFLGKTSSDALIDNMYSKVLYNKRNIVFIGMPSCGKTTIGKILSADLNKEFIDTDILIENKIHMPISDFIKHNGIDEFRKLENETVKEIYTSNNKIISTGGGCVLNEENVMLLKQNSIIIFINRSLEKLKPTSSRPLSSNYFDLKKLYHDRLPIYKKACDIELSNSTTLEELTSRIKEILWNF